MTKKILIILLSMMIVTTAVADITNSYWSNYASETKAGATTTVTATKGGKFASTDVLPTVSKFGKWLGKGLNLASVGLVIFELFGDGVDWVLDPKNNSVIINYDGYTVNGKHFMSLEEAKSYNCTFRGYTRTTHVNETKYNSACINKNGIKIIVGGITEGKKENLSLSAVAEELIAKANEGDATAQQAIRQHVLDNALARDYDVALDTALANTANPAIPADTTVPDTKTDTKADEATKENEKSEVKEEAKPFDLPDFCTWAKWFCDERDVSDDTELGVDDSYANINTNIKFGGHCPNDVVISGTVFGTNISFVFFEWSKFCGILAMLKPIIIALSSYSAVKILGGVNVSS